MSLPDPAAVRAALLARLGPLPAAADPAPAPRVTRAFTSEGVRYERWTVPGPAGDELPAWFLAPESASHPLPGLLAPHPHGRQFELGKSWVAGLVGDPSRAYGLAAARAGFAVLAPDLPAFEDRRPSIAARKANYALQGEAYERLLAMNAIVQGRTLQGAILAELAHWTSVLARDARVDGARLGVLGHSFGGQEALFAMLFDPRLKAAVASCGFSLVRLLVERQISHNMALYLPGMLPALDFDTLVPAIAPRALYVLAGRDDRIYPVDGVLAVAERARAAWDAAGAPAEAFALRVFDGGHDLREAELATALAWLRARLAAAGPARDDAGISAQGG